MRRRMPTGLKAEVEAAVVEEVGRVGPSAFTREPIVARFRDQAGRTTLYRWIDACMASGRPVAAATGKVKAAVAEIIAKAPDPAQAAHGEVLARIPAAVTVADASADPGGICAVIERTARIMRNLEKLELHTQTPEGAVRNPRLLLQVTMGMNRALDTAVRIREALRDDDALQRRTAAFLEEIRKESPDCARRIAVRLQALERVGGV